MKVRNLLFGTLWVFTLSILFTACAEETGRSSNDTGSVVELPNKRVYILNEGKYQANNAGIAFYAPNKDAAKSEHNFIANIYQLQNQKGLGDTAQDMLVYEESVYVIVYGSKLLLKLNAAGVEQKRLSFGADEPRNLVAEDGKIYVTLYSGEVARVDAETLQEEGRVAVGKNPEGIVSTENRLYVANSEFGKGTTVSVIDIPTFKEQKKIEVVLNPNRLLEENDEVYLISWGDWGATQPYSFQRIRQDGTVEQITAASHFASNNDVIYLIHSSSDWSTGSAVTVNSYFTYDTKSHTLNRASFLKNMPDELGNSIIYALNIDDKSGEIYIATSDYTSNGDVYRFSSNGTFMEKFDSGGINPRKLVFLTNS